jgi:transposase
MEMRELRALEIAARQRLVCEGGVWLVPSQSSATKYRVTLHPAVSCTCEDFLLRQDRCKHILAAEIVRERAGGAKGPDIETDGVPKRPTYRQNWPAYNLAQREEKRRFMAILADLCAGLPEPERAGVRGRKPHGIADRLFAVCFKVYTTLSSRRFGSDLADAYEKGYLSANLHPNKVNIFLESPEIKTHLHTLLTRSALPLRAVETTFAPDSSGFSVSRHVKWVDEKYGKERSGRDWVKVHLMVGVKTGIVTAAAIYDRNTNDCPLLPELVKATAASGFTVKEVTADKGYLSIENVEAVHAVGGTPFIAPKVNTTGVSGGLFERMVHFYQFKRDEFLARYHQRSNVESVFSAIKRKFGDNVRSRTDAAMHNEALAKLVCNNLCAVILSQCELGIEATFWPKEEEAVAPALLPFVRPV